MSVLFCYSFYFAIQEIIKHHLPPSFPQWSITFPNDKIVQEVSARLRAVAFETCTPPNVYETALSISATKKTAPGEKSRRQYSSTSSLISGAILSQANNAGENQPPIFRVKESQNADDDENVVVSGRSLMGGNENREKTKK